MVDTVAGLGILQVEAGRQVGRLQAVGGSFLSLHMAVVALP